MAVAAKKGATTKSSGRKGAATKKRSGAAKKSKTSTSKKTGASKSKKTSKSKKKSGHSAPARKSAASKTKAREKDPRGGLTAAGRKAFAERDGSHLKPGVTKTMSEMTPQEMRRKGSWAVRFYGRDKLPPLVDAKGEPTRHALSAHAWGEPVPRTVAAARRIASKGERLLARYHRLKEKR